VLTLHALVTTWPPAAALLVASEHGALLPLLAGLHDGLLPAVREAFAAGGRGARKAPAAGALARLRLLEAGCLQLCWQLLRLAFLTHDYLGCAAAAQLYRVRARINAQRAAVPAGAPVQQQQRASASDHLSSCRRGLAQGRAWAGTAPSPPHNHAFYPRLHPRLYPTF
jgi:hypothetical protein